KEAHSRLSLSQTWKYINKLKDDSFKKHPLGFGMAPVLSFGKTIAKHDSTGASNRDGTLGIRFRRNLQDWELEKLTDLYMFSSESSNIRQPKIGRFKKKSVFSEGRLLALETDGRQNYAPKSSVLLGQPFRTMAHINSNIWNRLENPKQLKRSKRNNRCIDGTSTPNCALKSKCLVNFFSWSKLSPIRMQSPFRFY
ncbi:hypothetical protein H5410_037793, partial [Solanum commersonii]